MSDENPPSGISSQLTAFRQQIDTVDDKLIELLIERTAIVSRVGELKRKSNPGQCPIRAGREAEMVRRIMGRFEGTAFSPAAAAAIWRLLIGASTSVEGSIKFSAYAPDDASDLYWLAREYFGPFVPAIRQPQIKRVIGDVIDGKAAVGIVPFPRSADTTYWWTNLMQQGDNTPKIFAHIPYVHYNAPGSATPSGLAIAKIIPEATGDDTSLLVVEADHNVSQNRLQTAFSAAPLDVNWISVATLSPANRHHLIEIRDFITPGHEALKSCLTGLGTSIISVSFLGAYANPITLKPELRNQEPAANYHVAKSSKA